MDERFVSGAREWSGLPAPFLVLAGGSACALNGELIAFGDDIANDGVEIPLGPSG